ncbi:MAG: PBSX family phage terminase large subunit [Clostridiales bacterium]|nr:PBSX family phage terminase large subunit [Clostridiales bacterium]
MNIRLSGLLAKAYHPLFWDVYQRRHREYWLMGGRGSGKSSFVSIALICLMLSDPKANVAVYRKVADSLRESVYAQMRWAAQQLGLESYFTCRLSPLEMVYRPTGQRILFRGADDPEKSKGLKTEQGYFAALWFEEASAFHGMEELRTIQASVLRGGRGITLVSYNPPIHAQNWINAEALRAVEGRLYHKSDYRMLPESWLGEGFLMLAEQLKEQNERAYRHMYLGEAVGTGGQVFGNVTVREVPQEELDGLPVRRFGLDFGFAADPDALVECSYQARTRTLYIVGEYVRTGQSLHLLAEKCRELAGDALVRCDSAAPREIAELRRLGVNALGVKKGAGSVEHGIRWLRERTAIVIDGARCPVAAREFSLYEYQRDRNGVFVAECPDRDNHTIDAVRYAMEAVMNQQVVKLKKGGFH